MPSSSSRGALPEAVTAIQVLDPRFAAAAEGAGPLECLCSGAAT